MGFWMAIRLIKGNRGRIIFPFLGMMLGLASLIAIFSLGAGGEKSINSDLSILATNNIVIKGEIGRKDISFIERLPMVRNITIPQAILETSSMDLHGMTPRSLSIVGGSNLGKNEILLDKKVNIHQKIGDTIEIIFGGIRRRVRVKGFYDSEKVFLNSKTDNLNQGIVALSTLEDLSGSNDYSRVVVNLEDNEDPREVGGIIISKIRGQDSRSKIYLGRADNKYQRVLKIKNTLKLFLMAMCGISLFMGGFSMSSAIGSTVKEYTQSIGILRAYGVDKDIILGLFLYLATIISVAAGVVGAIVGTVISYITGLSIGVSPIFGLGQYIIIICVSLILGIIFGIIPAKKASEMEPIEALRV